MGYFNQVKEKVQASGGKVSEAFKGPAPSAINVFGPGITQPGGSGVDINKYNPFNPGGIFGPKKPAVFHPITKEPIKSELEKGVDKFIDKTSGPILPKNPQVDTTGIFDSISGTRPANPYEAAAAELAAANTTPDFTAANQSAQAQQNLAQALAQFYGTGAGSVAGLISDLQKQAQGNFGPRGSLAQAMLQQGLNQNIAGVRSQLASQRGLSPALAARYAAQQTAQLGGQTAEQAGIMGLQQQIAAQQQLGQLGMGAAELGAGVGGQLISKGREADIAQATATSDAQLNKLNILAQSDVALKQLSEQTGIDIAKIKADLAKANQAAAMGDNALKVQILGGILGGASQIGAAAVAKYQGGRIDGMPLVDGDHPKNDTVPAMLSPGEIVIPRSAAQDKQKAKSFLDALDGWNEKPSYAKVLKARRASK